MSRKTKKDVHEKRRQDDLRREVIGLIQGPNTVKQKKPIIPDQSIAVIGRRGIYLPGSLLVRR